jgi:ATP-dependent Clp protease adaptor protein ClpS
LENIPGKAELLPFRERRVGGRTRRSAPANRLETGGARVQNIHRFRNTRRQESTMSKIATKRQVKTEPHVERPRLHKVILFNDDYTPREFVVEVLKGVFRLNETQALNVMMTAHRKGVCVVAVFAQDVAETKAARGTEAGAAKGYPLRFGTEPEE